jgi:dolichol-phosphate mannosyltransferase
LSKIFPITSERLEEDEIDYEILVVNDNSKDNTEAVLQKINRENPQIRYNGFGLALRCGLENFSFWEVDRG